MGHGTRYNYEMGLERVEEEHAVIVFLNLESGQVVIIWLDLGEVNEKAIRWLANDFDVFLDSLSEEDYYDLLSICAM